jgi:hypothetical protein
MAMSALHLKADMCGARAYVRFGPIADSRSENGRYSITSNGVAAITKMVTINLRFANIYAGMSLAMMMSNPKKVTK